MGRKGPSSIIPKVETIKEKVNRYDFIKKRKNYASKKEINYNTNDEMGKKYLYYITKRHFKDRSKKAYTNLIIIITLGVLLLFFLLK